MNIHFTQTCVVFALSVSREIDYEKHDLQVNRFISENDRRIWINTLRQSITNWYYKYIEQTKTEPCAYSVG